MPSSPSSPCSPCRVDTQNVRPRSSLQTINVADSTSFQRNSPCCLRRLDYPADTNKTNETSGRKHAALYNHQKYLSAVVSQDAGHQLWRRTPQKHWWKKVTCLKNCGTRGLLLHQILLLCEPCGPLGQFQFLTVLSSTRLHPIPPGCTWLHPAPPGSI